ncbi:response regulator transcription factor [Fructilactobacillus vespulae]|uniref:response regulator transcription factor n=1 Tax=Fructilactobacillus vespulae TaxID=1249630 RepID=UPI0039B58CBB
MSRVFLVEDDPTINQSVQEALQKWRYEVVNVKDWNQVAQEVITENTDIVLMDITLPVFDGFYWTTEIRKQSQVPIIFISAADMNTNAVRAIASGADDYVTKPFSLDVLISKIQAILRRVNQSDQGTDISLPFEAGELNTLTNELSNQNESIKLTPTEGYLLKLLILNVDQIVTKQKLMRILWQGGSFIDEDVLNTNMSRLRNKMARVGWADRIVTVRKQGYRLVEKDG